MLKKILKPEKEKSDIFLGDVMENKTKKHNFKKMINPQKYVIMKK